jgi:4-hydroxy-3-polyprenylbenzoate decarboxylase
MKPYIVVAATGASGAIYTKVLLDTLVLLKQQYSEVSLVFSNNAQQIWKEEIGNESFLQYPFQYFDKHNFYAPFASGSSLYNVMLIVPCSMGTLGRIASGVSDDLITRAADVMLKERKKLIVMVREAPYSLIHINNMQTVTTCGGIVCAASPSFYSKPATIEAAAATITDRMLQLAGLEVPTFHWGENK